MRSFHQQKKRTTPLTINLYSLFSEKKKPYSSHRQLTPTEIYVEAIIKKARYKKKIDWSVAASGQDN